jgi:hypothetical protein
MIFQHAGPEDVLPSVVINGVRWQVDVRGRLLRRADKPEHVVRFQW